MLHKNQNKESRDMITSNSPSITQESESSRSRLVSQLTRSRSGRKCGSNVCCLPGDNYPNVWTSRCRYSTSNSRKDVTTTSLTTTKRTVINIRGVMEAFPLFLFAWTICCCPNVIYSEVIRLGVILPFHAGELLWELPKTRPGIDYAVESVRNRSDILIGHSIEVVYGDSKCSDTYGPLVAIDWYVQKSVHVFLGPVCDYSVAPIARFSRHWNVPVITGGALVQAFGDKKQFGLLTRMTGSYVKLGEYVNTIFNHFNWKQPGLIYHNNLMPGQGKSNCHFVMESVYMALGPRFKSIPKNANEDIWYKAFDENHPHTVNMSHVLSDASLRTRVVVLCASPNSVREIMIKAADLHFDNGEYVFFNIDLFSSKDQSERPWYREDDEPERNEKAKKAYEALMTVTLRKPESEEYKTFSKEVKKRAKEKYGNFTYGEEEVNSFVGAFHDAVILYALALNETLAAGQNATDGAMITHRMWNRSFEGITGNVSIDENGDRNADYSLLDLNPETEKFEVVANYYGSRKVYEEAPGKRIHWAGGWQAPPPDTPKCGFDGSGCPPNEPFPEYAIVIIVLGSLLLIVSLSAFFVYRHYQLEAQLSKLNWQVRWDDIMFGAMEKRNLKRSGSRMSLTRRMSMQSNISGDTIAVHLSDLGNKQVYTKTGYYKATLVAIKKINKTSINITKSLLLEFKRMRDLQNDHIVRFIGACIDPPNQCILTEYCNKGSLQDVLENEQISLDQMFKFSLIQDIVRGMCYLHSSEIRSHGNLKSSNCVVDSRFVLKITDFGLTSLRSQGTSFSEEDTYAYYKGKLWTAPELVRMHNPPPEGTQKGDVYSFAIICQEIIYRNGPFWVENMDLTPQEIYRKVKNGQRPYFRPSLEHMDHEDCTEDLANMVKKAWNEDPIDRADFHTLKAILRKINPNPDSGNILDNLLSRMEQYANNLETLVEERTANYLEQKKRAEDLLYMMLPKSVAGQLMRGESVTADEFKSVTIYFSDICGFTALSSESTPMQVVDLLNDLYTTFDAILENYDVYKVETIGDAYMVVSGLPARNGQLHAREISRMSLSLLNAVKSFKIRHRPKDQLKLRIGIHSGSCVAGVVGLKMPRYCLFGDAVNTASRMESNGEALQIHVSPSTKEILDTFGTFQLSLRGPVAMKGKGTMITWWLLGEENEEQPDLAATDTALFNTPHIVPEDLDFTSIPSTYADNILPTCMPPNYTDIIQ